MEHDLPTTPATSTELEPYRHAPTLLAGSTAGTGGKVKVWTPTQQALWQSTRSYMISGITVASLSAMWGLLRHEKSFFFFAIFILAWAGLYVLASLLTPRRMPYVTTDNLGIALATPKGRRAFRWDEIRSVEEVHEWFYPFLQFNVGHREWVTCSILGHSHEAQRELLMVIINQAQMEPDPSNDTKFVRSPRAIASSDSAALPPAHPDR